MFGYETNFAEVYDAGAPEAKFYEVDFDDSYFGFAKEHALSDWKLKPQSTKLLDIYYMKPEKIEKIDGGVRIYLRQA